jgi:hypothetical protein
MNITMQGKYQTRDGRSARVLAIDRKGGAPVVGLILDYIGTEHIYAWGCEGCAEGMSSDYDLIPVPTKHEAEMRWNLHDRIPVVQLNNGSVINLTRFLDLLAGGTATEAHVTWED